MFDLTSSTNPFPGLRPFDSNENHLFFGRDGQSDDLLQRLSRQRFIAVVGTSGSGKSSLVRAGLLPALHGGFMLRAGSNWRVAILRPGSDPIGQIAHALSREDVLGRNNIEEGIQLSILEVSLRRSALGLIDVVRQARMNPRDNLLIVVDQFEELFRVRASSTSSVDDAAAFVKLLLEATSQSEFPIYVLITMRSDFLGDCSQFRDLPEAINDGQYLIPRMTRNQRREAINGPVAVGRAEIAPRLVNRLLNDVGDNPDQLPVLQHALMRMWQHWEEVGDKTAPLDLSHYEAIGGLNEAISQHADEAYEELGNDRRRRIAEILFKLLTERGADNREIRRPTPLAEICAVAEAEEGEVLTVIEEFRREGRSFLMPPPNVELRPNTFIDISHESLIRGWRRLQRWVDDEALSARIYRRLAETAMLYRAGEAGLWRDPDLAIALAWREKNSPNAAWGARYSPDFNAAISFLEESRHARDAERMERERMRRRNLRLTQALAAVFLIGLCVSLALAAYAFQQKRQADQQADKAEESAGLAKLSEQRAIDAETATRRERDRAEENAQLAKQAAAEALRKKEEADQSAQRAQSAEAKAKASAVLAEQKAREADENFRRAEAARNDAIQARNDAIVSKEAAERAQRVANEERDRAYELSVRFRRNGITSDSQRLRMAQRLQQIAPAEERAYWKNQEGDAWSSLGNSKLAIGFFKSVLDEDPKNFNALSARGSQYLTSKEPEKALTDIELSLTINDKIPYLYLNKVLGLGYLGKYDEAIETARQGVKTFSHIGYGEYRERDVADEIREIIGHKTIYADSDAILTVFHYDIMNLAASGGSRDFVPSLEAALARPESVNAELYALNRSLLNYNQRQDYGALVAQGILWQRLGYCDKANESYDRFRKEHGKQRAPRYDGLARWLASSQQKLLGAKVRCRTSEQDREFTRDYMLDMMEYSWGGDFFKAESALTTAVNEAKDNPNPLIERMKFRYFNKGDFAGAKEDAQELIKMNKGTALAFLLRAMSTASLNPADATIINDVRKANELNPAVYPLISDTGSGTKGKLLVEVVAKTNRDDAIDLLRRSIQYDAPSHYPHYLLAKLLNDGGNHQEALAQINTAIALDRSRFDYLDEKARAEAGVNKGAKPAAMSQYDKFIDYREAGFALAQLGKTGDALVAYGESLRLLEEIAKKSNSVDAIACEAAIVAQTTFQLLKRSGESDQGAVEYFDSMFKGLDRVFPLVQKELKGLIDAR